MKITGTGIAFPSRYYPQEILAEALSARWGKTHRNVQRLVGIHKNTGVSGRYLALPLEDYPNLESFTEANNHYLKIAQTLGHQAAEAAIADAGLLPDAIDHVFFVSITGIATPSMDARLVHTLKLRDDVKRSPLFGLGCMAGASGIARAGDYVRAFPEHHALLVSVELCSLTLQRNDVSLTNIIASGLFGDGAGAVVISGGQAAQQVASKRKQVEILGSRSVLYPDTLGMMGWDISKDGFQIVLSGEIPGLVRKFIRQDVENLVAASGISLEDLSFWVCHPGGPKILDAMQESLSLQDSQMQLSRDSFFAVGNLSSASVIHILNDLRQLSEQAQPKKNDLGCLLALGPGLSAELVLLRW